MVKWSSAQVFVGPHLTRVTEVGALATSQNSCPTFALSKCHTRWSYTSSPVLARELFLTAVLTTHTLHSCLFDSTRHSYLE